MKISPTARVAAGLAAAVTAVTLSGCGSSAPASAVPSLSAGAVAPGSDAAGSGGQRGYSASRVAQLHAAAQCIRTHGVPTYQDPVLTANGQVYTDSRSIEDLQAKAKSGGPSSDSAMNAIRQACGTLMATAGFQPQDEAPAPPALVQAGVQAARCMRAHGLPNYRDPTSSSTFTPGHGFGMTANELPNNGALGKADPAVQRAFTACRTLLDNESRASTLASLAHG